MVVHLKGRDDFILFQSGTLLQTSNRRQGGIESGQKGKNESGYSRNETKDAERQAERQKTKRSGNERENQPWEAAVTKNAMAGPRRYKERLEDLCRILLDMT